MLSLKPHTPYSPPWTGQSNHNTRDKQAQPEALALPGVPTVDNEQHTSSTLDITPTLTQISSNHRPSDTVLDSLRPQIFNDHVNEAFAPPNFTLAALCGSTLAQANDTKALGSLKDNLKAVEFNEPVTGEMEIVEGGEEAVGMPYVHPHPTPLTFSQTEAAERLVAVPARTLSSAVALCSTPTSLSAASWPTSKMRAPAKLSPPSTTSRPTSIAPYKQSITDVEDHTLFPNHPSDERSRSPSSRASTFERKVFLSSSLTSNTSYSLSKTNQRSLNTRDEQDAPTAEDERYLTTSTYSSNSAASLTTSTQSPSILGDQAPAPHIYENHLGEVSTPRTGNAAAQCLTISTSTNVSEMREPRHLENDGKVGGFIEQATGKKEVVVEAAVALEGGEVASLLTMPERTWSPSSVHGLSSISLHTPSCNCYQYSSPPFHHINSLNGQQDMQNERLRILSRAASTNGCQGCMLSLTTNMPSLFVRALSNPTSPSMSLSDLGRSFSPIGSPPHRGERTFSQTSSCAQYQPIHDFVRTPSHTTSPSTPSNDLHGSLSPIGLPPASGGCPCSRRHSRAQSLPTNNFGHNEPGYSLPNNDDHTLNGSCSDPGTYIDPISSLFMHHENESEDDADSDLEDSTLGLVTDRLTTSSTVLLESLDKLDVLQRVRVDLYRKCMDAEPLKSHPTSPIMIGNMSNPFLSMHDASPSAQPHNLYQYPGSLHSRPPTPFPSFRQLKKFCGQPLLELQRSVPVVDKGHSQLAPSWSPSLPLAFHNITPAVQGGALKANQALILVNSEATSFCSNVSREVNPASSPCPGYRELLTHSSPLTSYTTISGCSSMTPIFHSSPPTLLANSSSALEQLRIFNDAHKQRWHLNLKTKEPRVVKEAAQAIHVTG